MTEAGVVEFKSMEVKKDPSSQIRLINQALNAAVSSINLARQLLGENGEKSPVKAETSPKISAPSVSARDLPGVLGTFDGQSLVTEDGQKFQVPENYSSKSMIVFGDKLKMVEIDGAVRFKQIERVKRQRAVGIIVKKEGRFSVVTGDGSYRILSAAVNHFGGKEGEEAHLLLPLSNKHVPFAALENISRKSEEVAKKEDSHPLAVTKDASAQSKEEKPKEEKKVHAAFIRPTPKEREKPKEEKARLAARKTTRADLRTANVKKETPPAPVEVKEEKVKDNSPLIGEDELR